MTRLEQLEDIMKRADARVTRLLLAETERAEKAKREIAEAREEAFRASAMWQAEAKAEIARKRAP